MTYVKNLIAAHGCPVLVESISNYSMVTWSDGTKKMIAYTQKKLCRDYGLELKMIRRGKYARPENCEILKPVVKVLNNTYIISKRMMSAWCIVIMTSLGLMAQNFAPVAVNDTVLVCNDVPTYFSVIRNDTDANGDKLKLNYFSEPTSGNLVSASNTGNFRYEWLAGVTNVSFQYNIKDLRFGNIGSLISNTATVMLKSAAPYYYTGSYSGNNTRETCRSINSSSVIISGTIREKNEAYQSIILDGSIGTVTISPTSGGSVEFKIK